MKRKIKNWNDLQAYKNELSASSGGLFANISTPSLPKVNVSVPAAAKQDVDATGKTMASVGGKMVQKLFFSHIKNPLAKLVITSVSALVITHLIQIVQHQMEK